MRNAFLTAVVGATLLMGSQALGRQEMIDGKLMTIDDDVDFSVNTASSTISTPVEAILEAVSNTNQTESAPADARPALPVAAPTVATNTSNVVVDAVSKRGLPMQRWTRGNVARRAIGGYTAVSDGTDPVLSKAALQAPAYLTYTVFPNVTQSGVWADAYAAGLQKCAAFCDRTPACVSFNLYREWNNPLLDWVFSEKSNLKCALFGDVAQTSQMTNQGGQQQKPVPEPLTKITDSAVYTDFNLPEPETPAGWDLAFGPINSALNSPGYLGYRALTLYSPTACAEACKAAAPDATLGPCTYFNIWRGIVNGQPTTYTCSLYAGTPSVGDATNSGDQSVQVTFSRGYSLPSKQNLIQDGGFETGDTWTGFVWPSRITTFMAIFAPHSGAQMAQLSCDTPTTINYTGPLKTVAGASYKLSFWLLSASRISDSNFKMLWNGNVVFEAPQRRSYGYTLMEVTVKATGNDNLSILTQNSLSFYLLDDVSLVRA